MSWFVVRTNIKAEGKAERNLRTAGFGTYLPAMKIERQHKRTKAWIEKTLWLMPRYLFVEVPAAGANWMKLRQCQGVESILGASNGAGEVAPFPVPDAMVARLIELQADMAFDDTRAAKVRRKEIGRNRRETTSMRFPVGSRVRAKDGPFAAFRGMVTNVNAKGEVEAMIEIFGRLTPATFQTDNLELADREKAA